MENASKALIMAGGILVGVLILALIATLFVSSNGLTKSYETSKQAETIQQFNVNFTKYLGQDLTIHEVVSICNFARENNIRITSGAKTSIDIEDTSTYTLVINSYTEEGYINSIAFN